MNLTAKAALTMLPIVTLLILMLVLRWSAARAGVISLFVTILVAWLGFGYGSDVYANMGIFGAIGGAFSEAVLTAGTILWIIFPALCIHHFQVHTGAIEAVKEKTASLAEDPRIIALLIFWFFALFGEGLAGFGTPVALTAPFLVAIALIAMLSLSQIMVHAGMIAGLSAWAAQTAGGLWPLLSPLVGFLGTFVTGSATASNILFTDFQQTVANNLGLPALSMVGAQGFGAAVGNIICPHNIIVGGATVGLAGKEGGILRKTMVGCLVYSTLGGLVALGLARFQ